MTTLAIGLACLGALVVGMSLIIMALIYDRTQTLNDIYRLIQQQSATRHTADSLTDEIEHLKAENLRLRQAGSRRRQEQHEHIAKRAEQHAPVAQQPAVQATPRLKIDMSRVSQLQKDTDDIQRRLILSEDT